jgi:uncharacterized membrane protein
LSASSPNEPPPSAWMSLGPVDQAREWEEFKPGTFEQVFALAKHEAELRQTNAEATARHERTMDYIAVGMQVATLVFALAAVVVMAWLAKYYADHGAAADGWKIFGFGAASIVAAFLGVNKAPISERLRLRKKPEGERPEVRA